jgi:hypothetical protein
MLHRRHTIACRRMQALRHLCQVLGIDTPHRLEGLAQQYLALRPLLLQEVSFVQQHLALHPLHLCHPCQAMQRVDTLPQLEDPAQHSLALHPLSLRHPCQDTPRP